MHISEQFAAAALAVALAGGSYAAYRLGLSHGSQTMAAPVPASPTMALPQGTAEGEDATRRHIASGLKAKTVAVMYVNNDFGKGGLDMIKKALAGSGTNIVAEISTDAGQVDFSPAVLKAKSSNADAVFVYSNEEESARALRELRKQGWNKPIIGETTLTGQKVIELAGDAANGAVAHVGLTVDAPNPEMLKFKAKFYQDYKYISDHNGIKGYTGVYILKAAIEKAGYAAKETTDATPQPALRLPALRSRPAHRVAGWP